MATSVAPTSQKNRAVSFRLDDRAAGRAPVWVHLLIRPEELTRTQRSRTSVHQTLSPTGTIGWADSFGPGLPSVTISGHTGWHYNQATGMDGMALFKKLHDEVFENWHLYRQQAVDAGLDPTDVDLIFVDELDGFAYKVIPLEFTLRRSRSRPLLMQFSIRMQAVSTLPDIPVDPELPYANATAGLTSLDATIAEISGAIDVTTNNLLQHISNLAVPVKQFMLLTQTVFQAAYTVESDILTGTGSVASALIGVASDIAQAGRNIFWTINGIANLPQDVMYQFGQVAQAYSNAFCLFANSLRIAKTYPQYSDLYGASNCSSTTGGSPLSPYGLVNTFDAVRPLTPNYNVSVSAQSAINTFKSADPALHPMLSNEIQGLLNNMIGGITGIAA